MGRKQLAVSDGQQCLDFMYVEQAPSVTLHNWDQQLLMSHEYATSSDAARILKNCIPGACRVEKASTADDKKGIDFWVHRENERSLSVDIKTRKEDYFLRGQDDLALETWSVVEEKKIGWTRDSNKQCDYVMWLWQNSRRYCIVPFPILCSVFSERWEEWRGTYRIATQRTFGRMRAWHSECVFVPRKIVWRHIYRQSNGAVTDDGIIIGPPEYGTLPS